MNHAFAANKTNEVSMVSIHQINSTQSREIHLPETNIKVVNILTVGNTVSGYTFQVYLESSIYSKSNVLFENCVCRQSSAFLRYHAFSKAPAHLLSSYAHQLFIVNTEVSSSITVHPTISISNNVNTGTHTEGTVWERMHSFLVVHIKNCSLHNNTAQEAVLLFGCPDYECNCNFMQLFLEGSLLKGNVGTHYFSAALKLSDASYTHVQISNCSVLLNTGTKGAIAMSDDHTSLNMRITDSHFYENFANSYETAGGAFIILGLFVSLSFRVVNSIFDGNSADPNGGGALHIDCGSGSLDISVVNSSFHGKEAGYAGAINIGGPRSTIVVSVTDSTFFENRGETSYGAGGIQLRGFNSDVSCRLTNSHFLRNFGLYAALRFYGKEGPCNISVTKSIFEGNRGLKAGSVSFWLIHADTSVSLSGNQFIANTVGTILLRQNILQCILT